MNRSELVSEMASRTKLPKKTCEVVLGAFMDTVKDTVSDGESIQLVGFGTFSGNVRKAKTARNPIDGSTVDIPETLVPKFRPSKALKDLCKEKYGKGKKKQAKK